MGEEGQGQPSSFEDQGNDWDWILIVCAIVFTAAIIAGLLPFSFTGGSTWMAKVTAVGSGLCIGAALGMMLPEGFHLLFEAHDEHGLAIGFGGFALTLGIVLCLALENLLSGCSDESNEHEHELGHRHHHHHHPNSVLNPTMTGSIKDMFYRTFTSTNASTSREEDCILCHPVIEMVDSGISWEDQLSHHGTAAQDGPVEATTSFLVAHPEGKGEGRRGANANEYVEGRQEEADMEMLTENESLLKAQARPKNIRKGWSTLVLLVAHSTIDGLVIGATAASGNKQISLVVALAMVAHKIPASFSLTSYLLSLRWPKVSVILGLVVFSLSAPCAGIIFYSLAHLVSKTAFEKSIGPVMLFSTGSILYVGVFHMFPEALRANQGQSRALMILLVGVAALGAASLGFIPD